MSDNHVHHHTHYHYGASDDVLFKLFCALERIEQKQEAIMSAVSDFAAKVNANFATIQAGITSLDQQIQAFQNSPGTLSPEDQAALDAIVAQSSQLATAASAPVTPPVPPAA